MRRSGKSIIALESWDGFRPESKNDGMNNFLRFITSLNGVKLYYRDLHTPEEMFYYLRHVPITGASLLYFAMHGEPELIQTGAFSEFKITLKKLAKTMGRKYVNFGVHFASCAVMNSWDDTLREFKESTGVKFVSGYTEYVDFGRSAIVDHIFISEWMYSQAFTKMFKRMKQNHKKILEENGFSYIV